MNAIDRAKLLAWLERNGDPTDDITEWQDGFTTCCKMLIEHIKSGAFDIKPPEVQWREQKLKNGWAQYRIDKLEKVETHD